MSNHSWISVNKKTRTKDDLARVVLSELIDEEKVCYYCLMNRCNNKEHDKREQKLQRCKVFFNKIQLTRMGRPELQAKTRTNDFGCNPHDRVRFIAQL